MDASTSRIVQAHHRGAVAHREVHHLADLFRVSFAQRAAEHSEVLAEHIGQAPVHVTIACDHPVAEVLLFFETEVSGAVRNERTQLFEAAFVQQ